jgi:tRNA pseudouridine38-40 synthase
MTDLESLRTRYGAVVEYDGTAYQGFQRQLPEQPTVQGVLEKALGQITGEAIVVTGAGRTDSGVHARGQVISFELQWRHGIAALQKALNANLPADVAAKRVVIVPPTFHPRFDARWRAYEYYVLNEPVRSPLRRMHGWHIGRPLDMAAMNRAAACLIGTHDFTTFGSAPQGDNTVRRVYEAYWEVRAEWMVFRVKADAFLYRMVRSLAGTLCRVGDGSWQEIDFREAFAACDRSRAGGLAPAQGLYLDAVGYDTDWFALAQG